LSGSAKAVLWLDGNPAATNSVGDPFVLNLNQGTHSWQVAGFDKAGNQGWGPIRTLFAVNSRAASISRVAGGVTVNWPSVAGQIYRVVYKTNFTDNWRELSGPVTATASTTTWSDSASGRQRFYQIVQ